MAFPFKSSIQVDPGPHGEGLQGSGFGMHWFHWTSHIFPLPQCLSIKHSTQPSIESGIGTKPASHLKNQLKISCRLPKFLLKIAQKLCKNRSRRRNHKR